VHNIKVIEFSNRASTELHPQPISIYFSSHIQPWHFGIATSSISWGKSIRINERTLREQALLKVFFIVQASWCPASILYRSNCLKRLRYIPRWQKSFITVTSQNFDSDSTNGFYSAILEAMKAVAPSCLDTDSAVVTKLKVKEVRFCDTPTIHILVVYASAARLARQDVWMQAARDRDRFNRRIKVLSMLLTPCLQRQTERRRFKAAVRIQAAFKGYLVRKRYCLAYLNTMNFYASSTKGQSATKLLLFPGGFSQRLSSQRKKKSFPRRAFYRHHHVICVGSWSSLSRKDCTI